MCLCSCQWQTVLITKSLCVTLTCSCHGLALYILALPNCGSSKSFTLPYDFNSHLDTFYEKKSWLVVHWVSLKRQRLPMWVFWTLTWELKNKGFQGGCTSFHCHQQWLRLSSPPLTSISCCFVITAPILAGVGMKSSQTSAWLLKMSSTSWDIS